MVANLRHLLDPTAQAALDTEVQLNVKGLFALGELHFQFAEQLKPQDWRQIVSRLYYAAFNISRALRLHETGTYSTDVTDHKKVGELPKGFPQVSTYSNQLPLMRDDRNLCDYDHTALVSDLITTPADAEKLVRSFIADSRSYLASRGTTV